MFLGKTIFLIFCLSFSALSAAGGERTELTFKVLDISQSFVEDSKGKHLLSSSCHKGVGKISCQAFEVLKSATLKSVGSELKGGMNPGSWICRNLSGEVAIGTDERGNENSFCIFKDESIASCDTLHFHAMKNDRKGLKKK